MKSNKGCQSPEGYSNMSSSEIQSGFKVLRSKVVESDLMLSQKGLQEAQDEKAFKKQQARVGNEKSEN